jgi:DNA-binding transcriptional LysR family regulator
MFYQERCRISNMLNVDRLRALHAVAAHGSILAAAETLHVTTSAVSQQLAKLERETGRRLLEKQGRGVRLTDSGRLLAAHAGQVLGLLERAAAELDAARDTVSGTLAIGAFATSMRGLAPAALGVLRQAHPQLVPVLRELEPADALPLVVRRDLDLAVAQDWENAPLALPEGLSKAPLMDDIADIALPAGHRLARARTVRLDDLAGEAWITWLEGSICHDWLLHTLRRRGHEPKVAHTASEYATQLALVGAGRGAARARAARRSAPLSAPSRRRPRASTGRASRRRWPPPRRGRQRWPRPPATGRAACRRS